MNQTEKKLKRKGYDVTLENALTKVYDAEKPLPKITSNIRVTTILTKFLLI